MLHVCNYTTYRYRQYISNVDTRYSFKYKLGDIETFIERSQKKTNTQVIVNHHISFTHSLSLSLSVYCNMEPF